MLTRIILVVSLVAAGGLAIAGCSSSSSNHNSGGPVSSTPTITDIDNSTVPASAVGQPIEINGTNFGETPGTVSFSQGTSVESVTPVGSGAWTSTNILVNVPSSLTAPGIALVTVTLAGASPTPVTSSSVGEVSSGVSTSAPLALNLIAVPVFTPSSITWQSTAPLPTPLRAHTSVAVRGATPLVYVIGGNTGNIGSVASNTATANSTAVYVAAADSFGAITSWTTTAPLPTPAAFAASAEADPTNSPVAIGQAFIYVVGGQALDSVEPTGTSLIYVGNVTLTTGQVTWSLSPVSLPEVRMGAQAVVNRGFLIVTGGTGPQGLPLSATAVAPISANGSLGTFTENIPTSSLPTPVTFHQSFAAGSFIYVLGGNTGPTGNPFADTASTATAAGLFAPFRNGEVGTWVATGSLTAPREKFVLFQAFGQVFVYEGTTTPGGPEGESSSRNVDGSLNTFQALSGSAVPGLNVFNAAGAVNSVPTPTNTPTFLISGGDSLAEPGTLSTLVSKGSP